MASLALHNVRRLAEPQQQDCVSIYLPTQRRASETREGPIRLKNRLAEAEKELLRRGRKPAEAGKLLKPAQALVSDSAFWQHQLDGLALFLASDRFEKFLLPVSFEELTVVAGCFHILPLLDAVEEGSEFYLVAVSQLRPRLFYGSRFAFEELPLPEELTGTPEARESGRGWGDLQLRTFAGVGGGEGAAVYHGHRDTEGPEAERLMQFLRMVNDAVLRNVQRADVPLIFAGDVSLFAPYRQANTHPGLLDEFITGNPDTLGEKKLFS